MPQQMPDTMQPSFHLIPPNPEYEGVSGYADLQQTHETFPPLQGGMGADMHQMAPPAINIDFAPTNARPAGFEPPKSQMDQDSLTPPDRGRFLVFCDATLEQKELNVSSQVVQSLVLGRSRTPFTRAAEYSPLATWGPLSVLILRLDLMNLDPYPL